MDIANRLRSYKNGVHGQFFIEVADRIEELESENENLHIENDTLSLRVRNQSDLISELQNKIALKDQALREPEGFASSHQKRQGALRL